MRKIVKISSYVIVLISALLFNQCQENDYEFGDIIAPSNIEVTVEVVGKDTTNPYGDGSGQVHFTAVANNAITYKYVYNGSQTVSPDGKYTYNFSELGINAYQVTVIATGTAGVVSSKTVEVEVLALYSPPEDLITLLTNNNSQTWRIKSEEAGHFGVGPAEETTPIWYAAAPGDKASTGMYDDRYVFNNDGSFTIVTNYTNDANGNDTSGTIFGKATPLDNDFGDQGLTPNGNDEHENYAKEDYNGNWTLTAPGGMETISLTNNGFLGFYVGGNHSYTILSRTSTEMKLKTIGAGGLAWFFTFTTEEAPTGNGYTYNNLVWEDDFNTDGAPDASKWTYDTGAGGWGNGEEQFYTDRADNVNVANGNLIITAKKEAYSGSNYTSARIKTQGLYNFKYGRVEVKAKLPEGAGTWPAIWMLGSNFPTVGWPQCGEIDIMEQTGANKAEVLATTHWFDSGTSTNASYGNRTAITNASSEFHVYTMEWTDQTISIYLDDAKYYEFANSSSLPFNDNFFLILNVAMGGSLGGTVDAAFTQATMEVDYIRVYQ